MEQERESSKGGFKSSFAQEVAENIRNSSSFAKKQQHNRTFLETTANNNPFTDENYPSRDPFYQRSLTSPNSLAGRLNKDEGASLTSGYFDSSSIDFYQDEIFSKDRRSSNKLLDHVTKMPSLGDRPDDVSLCSSSSNTWMTSSQFVKLLEIQEAKENVDDTKVNSKGISLGM